MKKPDFSRAFVLIIIKTSNSMKILPTKIYIYFWTVLVFFIFSYSCNTTNTDKNTYRWYKYWGGLNGEVKCVHFSQYNNNDSLILFGIIKFDKLGRQIEHIVERETGKFQEVFEYNNNEEIIKLTSQIQLCSKDLRYKNGKLISKNLWIDSLDKNNKLVKQSKYIDNKLVSIVSLFYSTNGKLIYCVGKKIEDGEIVKETFVYDEKGRLSKTTFQRFNKDSVKFYEKTETYNSNGQVTSILEFEGINDFVGKEIFDYDSLGNLLYYKYLLSDSICYHESVISESIISYTRKGLKTDSIYYFFWSQNPSKQKIKAYTIERYKFNKDGRVQKRIIENADSISSTTSYIYNSKGILIEEKMIYKEGSTIVKYDNVGNQILKLVLDNKNSIIEKEKKLIKYDNQNNMVEIKIFKGDTLQIVMKNKFEYY